MGDLRPFHPNTPQRLRSLAPPKDRKVLAIFVLSITDRCNIACDFCCHPYMDSEIASDDAERLVHEAVHEDFDEIGITGGETFPQAEATDQAWPPSRAMPASCLASSPTATGQEHDKRPIGSWASSSKQA